MSVTPYGPRGDVSVFERCGSWAVKTISTCGGARLRQAKRRRIPAHWVSLLFFIWRKADGLKELYPLTVDQMRAGFPGLVGALEVDNMGHWLQREMATW